MAKLINLRNLLILFVVLLITYFSFCFGIYISHVNMFAVEVNTTNSDIEKDEKILALINAGEADTVEQILSNLIEANKTLIQSEISNYNNYNYFKSLIDGYVLLLGH